MKIIGNIAGGHENFHAAEASSCFSFLLSLYTEAGLNSLRLHYVFLSAPFPVPSTAHVLAWCFFFLFLKHNTWNMTACCSCFQIRKPPDSDVLVDVCFDREIITTDCSQKQLQSDKWCVQIFSFIYFP